MNRIYMTFLTQNDLKTFPWLKEKNSSALAHHVDDYIVTNDTIVDKLTASNTAGDINTSIRPVIKSNTSLIPFIEKYRTDKGNLDFKNISFGTYPLYYTTGEFNITPGNCVKTGKQRTVIWDGEIKIYDEYSYEDRKFIFINNDPIEIKPLEWEYNDITNSLICKQIICDSPKSDSILFSYIYMNYYLFRELLENYEVDAINSIKLVDGKNGTIFAYPYDNYMEIDENGNAVCHDAKSYNLIIPKGVKKIKLAAINSIVDGDNYELNLNIDIDGENLKIGTETFDFDYLDIDASINSLTVRNITKGVEDYSFSCKNLINNITIPCDFTLFSRLYLGGNNKTSKNLFRSTNLTLTYKNEKELINFISDVNRFLSLIIKSNNKCAYRNLLFGFGNSSTRIDFTYKHNWYMFADGTSCMPSEKLLANKEILSILKVSYFTLKGPTISVELVQKLFPNFSVKKEFTDVQEKDNTKQNGDSKVKEEKPKLSKETEHILDLAREIMSIDYVGLDKEDVRTKVTAIIDEYNTSYVVEEEGLSLSTNEGLYTNTVIKLENLRDSLYRNFEKNMEYYDILDLIENMIKKLNDEGSQLNYEILKDLDTLNNILKYSEDNQTKMEITTYLESERQNIIDYLCSKKGIDYKTINEFVKRVRLYLVPILTRVSGIVSKIDVMEQIQNYALTEMNNKSTENTNNYIRVILTEIDKIKQLILELDSSYTFEEIYYSRFDTGEEIIDYLDKIYMKYYRVYLDLLETHVLNESYEKAIVPKLY